MENIGLVLEGGGMRGIYTCGALEFFMDKDIYFNYIIGVSAGACNAVSYISGQKGRNRDVIVNYCSNWRYMSIRNLILNKSFIGMDFIFDEIPKKHVKFDFDAFYKANCKFLVGVTDCDTGKPLYINKEDVKDGFEALRATSSLPLITPMVDFKGYKLLDGGISDSIPIAKSIKDGNEKNIIILTRDKSYRKSPIKYADIIKYKYRKYPRLVNALLDRYKNYNQTLDYIDKLEAEGKAIVIRHEKPLNVGRLERNPKKLDELFQIGYEDTKNSHEKIIKFIKS